MASVHDFDRNKWRYLELVDYFELLATENAHIGHDPLTHKAFVRTDIMDIGRAKTTGLMSPYLAIEDPSARPLNDNMENIQLLWSTAIVVGIEVRTGDEAGEREAMDRAVRILVTILARLKEDRRRMRILDFEFPSVRINKVREHFRNTVGYRMAFDFPTQMDLSVTPQDWPDYDFSQDLPAFAKVMDQGEEIRLGVNGLHICTAIIPAQYRLVNTNSPADVLDEGTFANGEERDIVAPGVDFTVNDEPLGLELPAGVPFDLKVELDGQPASFGYDPNPPTLQLVSTIPPPMLGLTETIGLVTYYGWAPEGSATSADLWRITRVTGYLSGAVDIDAPQGGGLEAWDNRTTLTYEPIP